MENKNGELIYVACAFQVADPAIRKIRIEAACFFCAQKMREGIVVFCPLIHNYFMLKHGLPIGWSYWEKFNTRLLIRASALYVLKVPDWEKSIGIQAEIKLARKHNLPIEYYDCDISEVVGSLAEDQALD